LELALKLSPAIPIFRIFSIDKAREFYVDFLGFKWEWEHRFSEDAPLYAQISRDAMTLHLSEHFGDATPGSALFVPMKGIDEWHAELTQKNYRHARPGVETMPWGRVLSVSDPFGNRISFCERAE
jgi:catechol 2,3-dioxygenase-like lactoylglutathione lyase family enzyme